MESARWSHWAEWDPHSEYIEYVHSECRNARIVPFLELGSDVFLVLSSSQDGSVS